MRSKSAGWGEQTSSHQITPEVFDDEKPLWAFPVCAVSNVVIASSSHLTDRSESRSCADDDYVADDGEDCRSIFTTNKGLKSRVGYGERRSLQKPDVASRTQVKVGGYSGNHLETKGHLDAGAVDRSPSGRLLIRCIEERSADDSDSSKCSKVFSLG
ncbi:uncharacterized protein CCOS01_15907 [Colletotrichum costaricense]|uniref:Uncharacterized protein n=2 Tax=Colletotrichum acutatum species complex TaxID=2707335 RepID=A0AAI9YGK2_9PEZI|nr:uncharacterized protein CCOS01_15907 [Colletotrichum costaricense]XP_060381583.1 uncharacterized protein CTAM01_07815 [Colletotrichum tamarilloi]KAK1497545.1 hypothetical protein CTAM01_07815 [Colletotrichum tamarilloi]KAK1508246.1 hypothetical protein CCOS01_15907 [Colletotrichum costaricense]